MAHTANQSQHFFQLNFDEPQNTVFSLLKVKVSWSWDSYVCLSFPQGAPAMRDFNSEERNMRKKTLSVHKDLRPYWLRPQLLYLAQTKVLWVLTRCVT